MWLVTAKRGSGLGYLPYAEMVEEALRWGWIDSLPRKLDATHSMRLVTPRKPRSAWSKINRATAERLIESGLMHSAGRAKVEAAKQDGSWSTLDEVDALKVPADLASALRADAQAKANFDAFPPSSKRHILGWILAAKRPETRARRIAETVSKAASDVRANHYRQPAGAAPPKR